MVGETIVDDEIRIIDQRKPIIPVVDEMTHGRAQIQAQLTLDLTVAIENDQIVRLTRLNTRLQNENVIAHDLEAGLANVGLSKDAKLTEQRMRAQIDHTNLAETLAKEKSQLCAAATATVAADVKVLDEKVED